MKNLTSRQIQILHMWVRGYKKKEIAEQLGISWNTVSAHIYNIYGKIGASSRVQAAQIALEFGWILEYKLLKLL